MCGIIGIVGESNIGEKSLRGLERLEYRGYDSAGFAWVGNDGVELAKTLGGVGELGHKVNKIKTGAIIGHSRWATHGEVNINNAHPHNVSDEIAIVHNGIIENHIELKESIDSKGVIRTGDTDTECMVHIIKGCYNGCWHTALTMAMMKMEGAYAIGMIVKEENCIYVAKKGSPLVIGIGENENYISSSVDGVVDLTSKFIIMDDGEFGKITKDNIEIISSDGEVVQKRIHKSMIENKIDKIEEGQSYMMKEIGEQPDVIINTLMSGNGDTDEVFGEGAKEIFKNTNSIKIVACGTSYNAGILGKYWVEEYVGIRCEVEIASEYVYRKKAKVKNELVLFISQSGETADTIASIKEAKKNSDNKTLSICNTKHSDLVRLSDLSFITKAGFEIGVASTKAFTAQLIGFGVLVRHMCNSKGIENDFNIDQERIVLGIRHILEKKDQLMRISEEIAKYKSCLFIGRGVMYPIAMEGALKLKEISYIHAEAYAGGELKHGPIALIDENMPTVALSMGANDMKISSNIAEIKSRKGKVFVFDDAGHNKTISPILMTVYMQLISFQVAELLGRNVDKPRNLAKSVTVE